MAAVFVTNSGGPITLILVFVVLAAVIAPAWAIGHAVGTSRSDFEQLGRSKRAWVGWLTVLFLAGDLLGLILAAYYLIVIRPQVNDVETRRRSG